jgi:hypothetical protein
MGQSRIHNNRDEILLCNLLVMDVKNGIQYLYIQKLDHEQELFLTRN